MRFALTTSGEKMTLIAEIIRLSLKGVTAREVSEELSLTPRQVATYLRFLTARNLLTLFDKGYFPGKSGVEYLCIFDGAADLADVDEALRSGAGTYWDKSELASRMREIIDK